MAPFGRLLSCIVLSSTMGACATIVPQFDVPNDPNSGLPTVRSIVDKITCELDEMLQDKDFRTYLLAGEMVAVFQLSLTVNDTGGLTPTLSYIEPKFTFGGSATLSQSREQNYTETLYYSLKQLDEDNAKYTASGRKIDCRSRVDTNLAGNLGLRQAVGMAIQSPHLKYDKPLSGTDGEFGGYVNFVVTKNINAVGPTWMLTNFKGPGGILGLSEVNTDRLTFAFARTDKFAKNEKQKFNPAVSHLSSITQNLIANQLFVFNNLNR